MCDGTNGTPDLRNRFIYGGDGTNSGATGGETSHRLTEAELPKIKKSITVYGVLGTNNEVANGSNPNRWESVQKGNSVNGIGSYTLNLPSFGGDQPHNNMPPYYVLAFMMKL